MKNPIIATITKFLYKIIYQHGVFSRALVNSDAEFKAKVIRELNKLSIKRIIILVYNSKITR